MADNKHEYREGGYLPQMRRARGLIAVLESVRQQERMRQQGKGLRPLSSPIVGHSRAEAMAPLLETITRNPA